jgi:hypothetical protein
MGWTTRNPVCQGQPSRPPPPFHHEGIPPRRKSTSLRRKRMSTGADRIDNQKAILELGLHRFPVLRGASGRIRSRKVNFGLGIGRYVHRHLKSLGYLVEGNRNRALDRRCCQPAPLQRAGLRLDLETFKCRLERNDAEEATGNGVGRSRGAPGPGFVSPNEPRTPIITVNTTAKPFSTIKSKSHRFHLSRAECKGRAGRGSPISLKSRPSAATENGQGEASALEPSSPCRAVRPLYCAPSSVRRSRRKNPRSLSAKETGTARFTKPSPADSACEGTSSHCTRSTECCTMASTPERMVKT